MSEIVTAIQSAFANQFLSGGVVLMAVGAVMALCRRLPFTLWNWVKRRFIVSVDVMNSDPAFEWLSAWLDRHPYSKRATRLSLTTTRGKEGQAPKIILTPAPGNHFFIYRRRLVWFHRDREAGGAGGGDSKSGGSAMSLLRRETYNIRVVGRSQIVVRELMEDARLAFMQADTVEPEIYSSNAWGYWNKVGPVPPRPIESVVLPDDTAERLIADVREFLTARNWYNARGIPWRRGYLFEGVPGSGKSSIIAVLAAHIGLHLYVLNIGGVSSDEALASLMGTVKHNSIVLLEDIDAAATGREMKAGGGPEGERGITFSGLLNALDGVAAREGVLVCMTTNHKERLDPALIRPGRVDVEEHFDYATPAQAARLFARFYPGHQPGLADSFAAVVPTGASMAALQQHLLKHKHSPVGAVEAAARGGLASAS